jgi:hypothetical protein
MQKNENLDTKSEEDSPNNDSYGDLNEESKITEDSTRLKEPKNNSRQTQDTSEPQTTPKPFEYSSKNENLKKSKDEPKKPRFLDDKPRHKISSSVDKGRIDKESKSLNFKMKKLSENTVKDSTSKVNGSVKANNFVDPPSRIRQSIKKESIKLKKYRGPNALKKPKSKETKKRRRPRSNDDRKKEKLNYHFDGFTGKRTVSRGCSEKGTKEVVNPDTIKRRNIVDKFLNNSHMLAEQSAKIDSRNIYANNQKQKKNWNSASLNMKKFIKKKDLNMVYHPVKKTMGKKSQEIKLNSFKPNTLAFTAEQQFKSFMKNEKQFLGNPYYPVNTEFSKSFGSAIYNPNTVDIGPT